MTFEFEQLMEWARINIDRAESLDVEYSAAYVNISMAYTLIAIAQELHRMNDSRELEEAKIERLPKNISGKLEPWE